MKNVIKSLKLSLIAAGFLFLAGNANAQAISSHFFGQNAWMPDSIGNTYYGGKLHQLWPDIKASNPTFIRYGGIGADRERPTNSQFLKMVDAIRANGMEPTLQIPFDKWKFTAQQAADIVKFINITSGRNVKYWSIGNEPDLGYGYTSSSQVAAYVKAFATAMKNVDPTILIMGPETAWFNQGIINGLTTPNGPDDVTGKDANGRYYLDIISFHSYGFDGSQSRSQVISKLTQTGGLQDNLIYLNTRVAACNTAHNRTGAATLKTAITEANICWQNAQGDNLWGVGASSFIGGQYWAEMMGISLKHGVDFVNFWSVQEGGGGANTNIGYIEPSNNNKKPSYHHFKLMADNFKGMYVNGTTNKTNVKSFGSQNTQQIAVLILNQDQAAGYNYKVKLNTSAITQTAALNININANVNMEYSGSIQSQATVLLVFNTSGQLIKKYEYTLNNHAAANQPPAMTQYLATGVAVSNGEESGPEFEIAKAYPNPTSSKIKIQLNKSNNEDREYGVEVFDMQGRLVMKKKAEFVKGTEELDLSSSTLASAMYIVRVKYEDILKTTKIMLIK